MRPACAAGRFSAIVSPGQMGEPGTNWPECLGWWRASNGSRWLNPRREDARLVDSMLAAAAAWCGVSGPLLGQAEGLWLAALEARWRRNAGVILRETVADFLDDHLDACGAQGRTTQWRAYLRALARSAGWDLSSTHLALATFFEGLMDRGRAADYAPLDTILLDSDFVSSCPPTAGLALVVFAGEPPGLDRLEARVYLRASVPGEFAGCCVLRPWAERPPH